MFEDANSKKSNMSISKIATFKIGKLENKKLKLSNNHKRYLRKIGFKNQVADSQDSWYQNSSQSTVKLKKQDPKCNFSRFSSYNKATRTPDAGYLPSTSTKYLSTLDRSHSLYLNKKVKFKFFW